MPNESLPIVSSVLVIRQGLEARLRRLLSRPLIAAISHTADFARPTSGPAALLALAGLDEETTDAGVSVTGPRAAVPSHPPSAGRCAEDHGFRIPIQIDYEGVWREAVKEVNDTVENLIEDRVTLLTAEQLHLLQSSVGEFLQLNPSPQTAEVLSVEWTSIGGFKRATAIIVAEAPEGYRHASQLAVVPNLVPLQRQLDALVLLTQRIPHLEPLQALLGLCPMPEFAQLSPPPIPNRRLDAHQMRAVSCALESPHFALIQGPPGSGKTTVIEAIVAAAVGVGQRVLIVSPTHVAVDNVVEKLAAGSLAPHTLPVRYAAKAHKLSPVAREYWVSAKKQERNRTVARRVREHLYAEVPFAKALFKQADDEVSCRPPITWAHLPARVVCGTPIGILSYAEVARAETPFDILIVDEVSKLTMPEFLAIAVKARRWVLVGDPNQLPPYNNAEEHAVSLDALYPSDVELACSIAAFAEQVPPGRRAELRLVAVCHDPLRVLALAQLQMRGMEHAPRLSVGPEAPGVVLCTPDDLPSIPVRQIHDRTWGAKALVPLLISTATRCAVPEGYALASERDRAQARLFSVAMDTYHAYPWARRTHRSLPTLGRRKGLRFILPSPAVLSASGLPALRLAEITAQIAYSAIAIYDWLGGIATCFDVAPLNGLSAISADSQSVRDAVLPYTTVLCKQYRSHPSLSAVPRAFFYDGEAMLDGRAGEGQRVILRQVEGAEGEENPAEAEVIGRLIARLKGVAGVQTVMVITPYRKQEALLSRRIETPEGMTVEVCTLDRCQGREADYVIISLVRGRASAFMDSPKRWNVALTRAKEGLVIVGDIEAYLADRREHPSLLSQLLTAYQRQIRSEA